MQHLQKTGGGWGTVGYTVQTGPPTPISQVLLELHSLDSRILLQGQHMRRRLIRIALILLFFPPLLAAVAGWFAGPAFLHPIRRELTPDLIQIGRASCRERV